MTAGEPSEQFPALRVLSDDAWMALFEGMTAQNRIESRESAPRVSWLHDLQMTLWIQSETVRTA